MARPSANQDRVSGTELDAISGNLLANDSDPDGNALSLRFVDGQRIDAKHGPDRVTVVEGEHGTFRFKPDGSFTYELSPETAADLAPGELVVELLPYKVSDGFGGTDVSTLRLEIFGAPTDVEVRTIDFEDLEPGTTVPESYQGFDWSDGWTIATDDVGEFGVGNLVAKPQQAVGTIRLVDGADFDLVELVLNGETGALQTLEISGYNDGVAIYNATINVAHPEQASIPFEWVGVDELRIAHDPGIWIDEIIAVVPVV